MQSECVNIFLLIIILFILLLAYKDYYANNSISEFTLMDNKNIKDKIDYDVGEEIGEPDPSDVPLKDSYVPFESPPDPRYVYFTPRHVYLLPYEYLNFDIPFDRWMYYYYPEYYWPYYDEKWPFNYPKRFYYGYYNGHYGGYYGDSYGSSYWENHRKFGPDNGKFSRYQGGILPENKWNGNRDEGEWNAERRKEKEERQNRKSVIRDQEYETQENRQSKEIMKDQENKNIITPFTRGPGTRYESPDPSSYSINTNIYPNKKTGFSGGWGSQKFTGKNVSRSSLTSNNAMGGFQRSKEGNSHSQNGKTGGRKEHFDLTESNNSFFNPRVILDNYNANLLGSNTERSIYTHGGNTARLRLVENTMTNPELITGTFVPFGANPITTVPGKIIIASGIRTTEKEKLPVHLYNYRPTDQYINDADANYRTINIANNVNSPFNPKSIEYQEQMDSQETRYGNNTLKDRIPLVEKLIIGTSKDSTDVRYFVVKEPDYLPNSEIEIDRDLSKHIRSERDVRQTFGKNIEGFCICHGKRNPGSVRNSAFEEFGKVSGDQKQLQCSVNSSLSNIFDPVKPNDRTLTLLEIIVM